MGQLVFPIDTVVDIMHNTIHEHISFSNDAKRERLFRYVIAILTIDIRVTNVLK